MKLILSRKGSDSKYGRMPSPILPDGTLLSLPIPSADSDIGYDLLHYLRINFGRHSILTHT